MKYSIMLKHKKLFKSNSIFRRMVWINVTIMLVTYIVIGVVLFAFFSNYIIEKQVQKLKNASEQIQEMTIYMRNQPQNLYLDAVFYRNLITIGKNTESGIVIVDTAGEVIYSTANIRSVNIDFVKPVLNGQRIQSIGDFGGMFDDKVLTVACPIIYNDRIVGAVFLNARIPDLNKSKNALVGIFLITGVLVLLFAFIFIFYQARTISEPLKKINKAARDIAAGKFNNYVDITSSDEIGQLASSFNFMANSLAKLEEMRNSFVNNVSHELRTPMTTITGFVEGVLDGTIPEEKKEQYLNIVLDESRAMSRLVTDMLEMSKINSGTYRLDIVGFEINELVRLTLIKMEQRISDKNISIDVEFEKDSIRVLADKDSISRVIANLLDNAIKFTFVDGYISVKVKNSGKKVLVSVGNTGLGIENSDMDNLFDRFYKSDKSRGIDKSGAGLGLYIVKNILLLHRQHIWVENVKTGDIIDSGENVYSTKFVFTLEAE